MAVPDPLYVAAREVLLDALDALGPQRDAMILVGAQAIYLHTGDGDIAVPVFTTDADLAIDPSSLKENPRLQDALAGAGFRPGDQPGRWISDRVVEAVPVEIPIDLMVPEGVAGPGRRAARLGRHGDRSGRRARGLEGALVDSELTVIAALGREDPREFRIRVAGPAALLVAKLHKLSDRQSDGDVRRLNDKDALDVFRLLKSIPSRVLVGGLVRLSSSAVSEQVTTEAIESLRDLFSSTEAAGTKMAVRATEGLEEPNFIAESTAALADEVLGALEEEAP